MSWIDLNPLRRLSMEQFLNTQFTFFKKKNWPSLMIPRPTREKPSFFVPPKRNAAPASRCPPKRRVPCPEKTKKNPAGRTASQVRPTGIPPRACAARTWNDRPAPSSTLRACAAHALSWPVYFVVANSSPKRRCHGEWILFFFREYSWSWSLGSQRERRPRQKCRWATALLSQNFKFFSIFYIYFFKSKKKSFFISPLFKNSVFFLNTLLKKEDPKYCKYLSCIYLRTM